MSLKLVRPVLLVLTLVTGFMGAPMLAQAATGSQEVAQSYGTDTTVRQGMIVGLKSGDSSKVEPLSKKNAQSMLGVIVGASDAALSLSSDSTASQVYVASFGRYSVLVSNQNGTLKAGDFISISSLDGVGMKADGSVSFVLGKAVAGFDGSSNVISAATLQNGSGGSTKITIGSIPVDIGITANPSQGDSVGRLPSFLAEASSGIAQKTVSAQRVYLALAVMLLGVVMAGSLLYAGVNSTIIAIGRNPLAKRAIINGLMHVVLTSSIVLVLSIFAVYLLLKL